MLANFTTTDRHWAVVCTWVALQFTTNHHPFSILRQWWQNLRRETALLREWSSTKQFVSKLSRREKSLVNYRLSRGKRLLWTVGYHEVKRLLWTIAYHEMKRLLWTVYYHDVKRLLWTVSYHDVKRLLWTISYHDVKRLCELYVSTKRNCFCRWPKVWPPLLIGATQ